MQLRILGTRGIPAKHGGFETFAEQFSTYMASRGHAVTVYCQADAGQKITEDNWCGVRRVHVPSKFDGALGTIVFDLKSVLHARKEPGVVLTLGYNTAVFSIGYHRHTMHVMNMDGIEWKRAKWSLPEKAWLWWNERAGAWLAQHLVADHPEISRHLQRHTPASKITMIPYGAPTLEGSDPSVLREMALEPGGYVLVVARPEPENSLLEIVRAFSRRHRECKLVLLGNYASEGNGYQKSVLDAASGEVLFPGAIYERRRVEALRFFARAYVHGHTVGGTNPSLIEALGAGSAVIAHDNVFNRWVAGEGAEYFRDEQQLSDVFDRVLDDRAAMERMRLSSKARHVEEFTVERVMKSYEDLLTNLDR